MSSSTEGTSDRVDREKGKKMPKRKVGKLSARSRYHCATQILQLSGVRKRSFRKGVLGGTCLVLPGTFLFASETEKEHPKEL